MLYFKSSRAHDLRADPFDDGELDMCDVPLDPPRHEYAQFKLNSHNMPPEKSLKCNPTSFLSLATVVGFLLVLHGWATAAIHGAVRLTWWVASEASRLHFHHPWLAKGGIAAEAKHDSIMSATSGLRNTAGTISVLA